MAPRTFADHVAADRRFRLLYLLEASNGYRMAASLLHSALASFAHTPSHDTLDADLAWLAEQGLVALSDVGGTQIATLTTRGLDVALGAATVPGVRRRGPED